MTGALARDARVVLAHELGQLVASSQTAAGTGEDCPVRIGVRHGMLVHGPVPLAQGPRRQPGRWALGRWHASIVRRGQVRTRGERAIQEVDILRPSLRVQVALGGGELRVTEETLNPSRVGLAGDNRASTVPQGVEAEHAEAGRRRGAFEAAAQSRAVHWPAESRAEHVVVGAEELATVS